MWRISCEYIFEFRGEFAQIVRLDGEHFHLSHPSVVPWPLLTNILLVYYAYRCLLCLPMPYTNSYNERCECCEWAYEHFQINAGMPCECYEFLRMGLQTLRMYIRMSYQRCQMLCHFLTLRIIWRRGRDWCKYAERICLLFSGHLPAGSNICLNIGKTFTIFLMALKK